MKFFVSFVFSILFIIINGQNNSYNSLIIGKWELISHSKTPKKIIERNKRYIQFLNNNTFKSYFKNSPNEIEAGKWEIKNDEMLLKNANNAVEFASYKLYLLNKATLVIDEVFYYEELAKSTYKRIK